jgi:hypothetical protein
MAQMHRVLKISFIITWMNNPVALKGTVSSTLIVGVHPSGDDYRQKGQPHFSAPDF